MAVDDGERAWRLFRRFTSAYTRSWLVKRLFDTQPRWLRKLGMRAGVGFWNSHIDLFEPLMERVYGTIPGFGKM